MSGKIFILLGILFLLAGVTLVYFPSLLNWFGKMPGDIRVEGKSGSFYFPLVSGIIISIILTVVINLFFRR